MGGFEMTICNCYLKDLKGENVTIHQAGFSHAEAEKAVAAGGWSGGGGVLSQSFTSRLRE